MVKTERTIDRTGIAKSLAMVGTAAVGVVVGREIQRRWDQKVDGHELGPRLRKLEQDTDRLLDDLSRESDYLKRHELAEKIFVGDEASHRTCTQIEGDLDPHHVYLLGRLALPILSCLAGGIGCIQLAKSIRSKRA